MWGWGRVVGEDRIPLVAERRPKTPREGPEPSQEVREATKPKAVCVL